MEITDYLNKNKKLIHKTLIFTSVFSMLMAIVIMLWGWLATVLMDALNSLVEVKTLLYVIGVTPSIIVLIALVRELLFFLQFGFNKNRAFSHPPDAISSTDDDSFVDETGYEAVVDNFNRLRGDIDVMTQKVESLYQKLEHLKGSEAVYSIVSDEERTAIISQIKADLEKNAVGSVIEQIRNTIASLDKKDRSIKEVDRSFFKCRFRLSKELAALERRGNINLVIGIVITGIGLVTLAYVVLSLDVPDHAPYSFVIYFLPRVTLVILIELFAYFFLNLYKASLSEIKYFQNELTNLESRTLALKAAIRNENSATINEVTLMLAATERNHVLGKDQTTTEIEKARMESDLYQTIIGKMPNINFEPSDVLTEKR